MIGCGGVMSGSAPSAPLIASKILACLLRLPAPFADAPSGLSPDAACAGTHHGCANPVNVFGGPHFRQRAPCPLFATAVR